MKILIITLSVLIQAQWALSMAPEPPPVDPVPEIKSQTYRVTFTNNWNRRDHLAAPRNAHFSPIVAVTHDASFDLLPMGGLTSKDLELVAELGDTSDINPTLEMAVQQKKASEFLNTVNMFIRDTQSQTFDITVTENHPYISFVTMIAPSPDWVVGLSALKLYSESQGFYPGLTSPYPLYAIDAGTESGDQGGNFSINNQPTVPQTPISFLQGRGFQAPFAFVTIVPIATEE